MMAPTAAAELTARPASQSTDRDRMGCSCASKTRKQLPSFKFHSLNVWSAEPVNARLEDQCTSVAVMAPEWPLRRRACDPRRTSQTARRLSPEPHKAIPLVQLTQIVL